MRLQRNSVIDELHASVTNILIEKEKPTWKELVEKEEKSNSTLKGVTCHVYSTTTEETVDRTKFCPCGRLARCHSFVGQEENKYANKNTFSPNFITPTSLTVYGQLETGGQFIRCYIDQPNVFKTLAQLIKNDVCEKPDLLISCLGGAGYFTMTDSLEKEFMSGISQAAATKGVWLLTTGLNNGVSKLIGQSVHRYTLLNEESSKPTIIGLTGWGTVTEHTRRLLKQTSYSKEHATFAKIGGRWSTLNQNEEKTLDQYHTHFLLLDNGRVNHYLTDEPRSDFVKAMCETTQCHAITIIVEGGFGSLEVILNDLAANRPVVIIQGSGRLANVLGTLLENSNNKIAIERNDVKHQLELIPTLWPPSKEYHPEVILTNIEKILQPVYRDYLRVFKLERNASLTNAIFQAAFSSSSKPERQENFLKLAVSWNYIDGAHAIFKCLQNDLTQHYPSLFEQALKENRPIFVDYFLRRYHDPLQTTVFLRYQKELVTNEVEPNAISRSYHFTQTLSKNEASLEDKVRVASALKFLIDELYKYVKTPSDPWIAPSTVNELDRHYTKLIGSYVQSFYRERNTFDRFWQDFKSLFCRPRTRVKDNTQLEQNEIMKLCSSYKCDRPFDQQEMLRELFLWSVYAGYSDIAFVLLLQIKSRMGAALIAAGMAKRRSLFASSLDIRHTFGQQAKDYEAYATTCITDCYNHNERLACQLILRENPLFGNVTCMQIAIASKIIPFINTDCFNEVLNREWFGQLASNTTESLKSKFKFILCLASFGLFSPFLLSYRVADTYDKRQKTPQNRHGIENKGSYRFKGIEDQSIKYANYWNKLLYFHSSPSVGMCYHFFIYIWFLLIFSYMMLFHMKTNEYPFHWTKIYLIITVSAMLIEDCRKLVVDYHTQMLERWHSTDVRIAPMYAIPYILFYTGIGLHFRSTNRPDLFTAARIILAIDLELWYLLSLRFVSAVKLLGPKLLMIRSMLHDLAAFIYIIFVCIAAYGVVSRALTMYTDLELTAKSVFTAVFYRPYWFLYSIVEDETKNLDDIISNATTSGQVTEATVTHVLLAFHMLFINILILSLLIAVFNFSINDVHEKNEYVWRYQRYELIREYFEQPMFTFPPFSLFAYFLWFINAVICRHTTFRVFKRLCITPEMDTYWIDFENAATYAHARTLVEVEYRSKTKSAMSTFQAQVDALNHENEQIRADLSEMKVQTSKLMSGMDWVMKAMAGGIMDSNPPPMFEDSTETNV